MVGARATQPILRPAFPHSLSPGVSIADALLQCERANARLRAALAVPPSDPDHDYLCSWIDIVG
eukprot:3235772-Pleurochrysis_carterae.AAC.1